MRITRARFASGVAVYALALLVAVTAPLAQQGGTITTPTVPPELPVEIETELAPGSLKQAPLAKQHMKVDST